LLGHTIPPRLEPSLVDRISETTDDLAPSLHPHRVKQELHRYYEPVRRRCRVGTQFLPCYRSECSLSPPGQPRTAVSAPPSHVPRESRRSSSRRLYAGHRLASKWVTARLIPEQFRYPGFDVDQDPFRHFAGCDATPSRSLPDASTGAFSTSLTTTVFSQRSRWRLEASPHRATPRGQYPHLSRSTASRGTVYIGPPSTFVAHVGWPEGVSPSGSHRSRRKVG